MNCRMFGLDCMFQANRGLVLFYIYTNVNVGIRSSCMFKGCFKGQHFIKARAAPSVEHHARFLEVVGSNPTVGMNFFFRFRATGRSTGPIQMTFIQGNRCIERMII